VCAFLLILRYFWCGGLLGRYCHWKRGLYTILHMLFSSFFASSGGARTGWDWEDIVMGAANYLVFPVWGTCWETLPLEERDMCAF